MTEELTTEKTRKPSDEFLSVQYGAKYCGISYSAMKKIMSRNEIQFYRIGTRKYVFIKQQLDDYLAGCVQNEQRIAA